MLDFIKRIFSLSDENSKQNTSKDMGSVPQNDNIDFSTTLEEKKDYINNLFSNFPDLMIREVKMTNKTQFTIMLVYIENMIQKSILEESVINKLTDKNYENTANLNSIEYIKYTLGIKDKDIFLNSREVVDSILDGKLVLFLEGVKEAVVLGIKTPPIRNIEEPAVETVIRGPREGFTEAIGINKALIRKIIKSTKLKMEEFSIGGETKTHISVIYLSNIVKPEVLQEVRSRLRKIDVDAILGANYIKECIDDEPIWGIPTIFSSERPEVVAGKILGGRIAILIDGTPLAITVPSIFSEFLITADDYFLNFIPATVNRWIRYFSLLIALLLPAVYISIITFHQELIPTALLVTIIKARSRVPYPTLFECIIMFFAFEILREAGLRMPRAVGQAISVVGALVLGQAAVEAGLASTPMVIVVAVTSLASFAVPSTDIVSALILPRFIFILLGGFLGLIGVSCGIIILFMKFISVRSFGVPYMGPLAPAISEELPDLFMRRPFWAKFTRSWLIVGKQSTKRKKISHIKAIKDEQKNDIQENKEQ